MQAGDGVLRVLEPELRVVVVLPVLLARAGSSFELSLLGKVLDEAALPEVVLPCVVDGAELGSFALILLARQAHHAPRLTCAGLCRSYELSSALVLLLLFAPRGRTCWGVGSLGFLGVGAARLLLTSLGYPRTFVYESEELRG